MYILIKNSFILFTFLSIISTAHARPPCEEIDECLPPPPTDPIPSKPSSISLPTSDSDGSYTLNWGNATHANYYKVYEQTAAGNDYLEIRDFPRMLYANIRNRVWGNYHYYVKGCNASGCGPASDTKSIAVTAPGIPSSITFSTQQSSNGNYTVSWGDAPGSITHYQLHQRQVNRNSTWTLVTQNQSQLHNIVDIGDGEYQYSVSACENTLCSPKLFSSTNIIVKRPAEMCTTGFEIKHNRSLAITDDRILDDTFSFARVMNQIISTARQDNAVTQALSKEKLFQQWIMNFESREGVWPSQYFSQYPQCDDQRATVEGHAGEPGLNGYPMDCPRQERYLVDEAVFDKQSLYWIKPIGLFNRLDLAKADGSTCGEYRIAFGAAVDQNAANLWGNFLAIFEAVIENPQPELGIEGCRPITDFWATLSQDEDLNSRKQKLETFYFNGLPGFKPAIHYSHYRQNSGQIRTNSFFSARYEFWMLRDFKIHTGCTSSDSYCDLSIRPVAVKNTPWKGLMCQENFKNYFKTQLENLLIPDVNKYFMEIPEEFNAAESDPFHLGSRYDILNCGFNNSEDINNMIQNITGDNSITTAHLVNRMQTLTCGGCHQHSNLVNDIGGNLTWPSSLGFQHISETHKSRCEPNDLDSHCFNMSPALHNVFLPARQKHLQSCYNNKCDCSFEPEAEQQSTRYKRSH